MSYLNTGLGQWRHADTSSPHRKQDLRDWHGTFLAWRASKSTPWTQWNVTQPTLVFWLAPGSKGSHDTRLTKHPHLLRSGKSGHKTFQIDRTQSCCWQAEDRNLHYFSKLTSSGIGRSTEAALGQLLWPTSTGSKYASNITRCKHIGRLSLID